MYPYYSAIVVLASMFLYFMVTFNVGRARKKYDIKAPATTGNEKFECVYRTQVNTMEQLVLFLPCFGLFSWYISDLGAMILGLVWVFARIMYARSYYRQSEARGKWFKLGMVMTILLWIGGLWAVFRYFFFQVMVR